LKKEIDGQKEQKILNLGFILQNLSSGTLKYAKDLVEGLSKLGINSVAITLDSVNYQIRPARNNYLIRTPFQFIGWKPFGRLLLEIIRLPIAILKLIQITITEKITVLYTQNMDEGALLCCLVGFILRKPVVLFVQDLTDRELYVYARGFPKSMLTFFFALARVRHHIVSFFGPNIFVASNFIRANLEKYERKQIVVIPHGIDERVDVLKERSESEVFHLICIGKLELKKRFDISIKALSLLKDLNVHLMIIGEGPLRIRLLELAKSLGVEERVSLFGYLDESTLNQKIALADLGIVPSLWEGFGYVTLEMMRAGLPVLASDAGALPEIVKPGINGYLFKVNDYNELARIIRTLYNDHNRVEYLASGALDTARRFTIENMINITYSQLLNIVDK
jgi:glycosyltransferase involved in cell wall biosynthesis